MASCPSEQLNTGEVIRGCVADASRKDLPNFEPASLKPGHRLGAQSRRKNTHVTGTRCLSWPHWHPGRSQGRIICIAPELDQNGTRRLLREEPCVRLSKIITLKWTHCQEDGDVERTQSFAFLPVTVNTTVPAILR